MEKTSGTHTVTMEFKRFSDLEECLVKLTEDNSTVDTILNDLMAEYFEAEDIKLKLPFTEGEQKQVDTATLILYNYSRIRTYLNVVRDYIYNSRKQLETMDIAFYDRKTNNK